MSSKQVLYFSKIDNIVNSFKYEMIMEHNELYDHLIKKGVDRKHLDEFYQNWVDQLNTTELLNYSLFKDKVRKNIGKNPDPDTDFFIQKYICASSLSLMSNLLDTEYDLEEGFKEYYDEQIEARKADKEVDEEEDIDEAGESEDEVESEEAENEAEVENESESEVESEDEETDEGYEEQPEPKVETKTSQKSESKPEPKVETKTSQKVKSKPEQTKSESKVKSKPEPKVEPKTSQKVKSKPEPKVKYTIYSNYENRDIVLIEGPDQESLRQHFSESLLKKLFLDKEDKWVITRNNGINAEHNVNELVDAFKAANVPHELIKPKEAKVSKPSSKAPQKEDVKSQKEDVKTPPKKVLPKPTKNTFGNLADSNIVFLSLYTSKNKKFTLAIGRQNTKSKQKGVDSVLCHNENSLKFCKDKGWDKFLITSKRWENIQKFEDKKNVEKLTKLAPKP